MRTTPGERAEFVRGLRAMADLYERTDLDLPTGVNATIFCRTREDLRRNARALGAARKSSDSAYVNFDKEFSDAVSIQVTAQHQVVCTRVVTGTKTVVKRVPVAYEEQTVEEEQVEWVCPESFLEPPRDVREIMVPEQPE